MSRLFGIDFLRAMAILLVVFAHSTTMIVEFRPFSLVSLPFVTAGYLGVEVFFVISGFLIGSILIKTLERYKTFNPKLLFHFYARRWMRTIPTYFLAVTVFFAIRGWHRNEPFSENLWLLIRYLTFTQNIAGTDQTFGIAWTLAIEEWFYLVFPVSLLLLGLLLKKHKRILEKVSRGWMAFVIRPKFIVLFTVIIYVVIGNVLRLAVYFYNPDSPWLLSLQSTFMRIDAIPYGVLSSWIVFYYRDALRARVLRWSLFSFVIGFVGSGYYLMYLDPLHQYPFLSKTLFYTYTDVSLAFGVLYFTTIGKPRPSIHIPIALIAHMSYSLYLFHFIILYLLATIWKLEPGVPTFLTYWILTFLLSIVVYFYVESPMTAMREKFRFSKRVLEKTRR